MQFMKELDLGCLEWSAAHEAIGHTVMASWN